MTEIEKKALALVNEEPGYSCCHLGEVSSQLAIKALCRAIEQHEAFRQEVSDAVERCIDDCGHDGLRKAHIHSRLARFIIAKPDPLVEAMIECGFGDSSNNADDIRAALAKRGLEIREVE